MNVEGLLELYCGTDRDLTIEEIKAGWTTILHSLVCRDKYIELDKDIIVGLDIDNYAEIWNDDGETKSDQQIYENRQNHIDTILTWLFR